MKSNGKSDPTVIDSALVDDEDILDEGVGAPTKPVQKFHCAGTGEGYKYYKTIPWDEWWNEFSTGIDSQGHLKYKTVWSYIKAKVKDSKKRQYLYEMIGPMPDPPTNLRVPWLGDWQKRRASGFWALDDPRKMRQIQAAIKQKQDSLDAAKAVAPLTVQQMQRFTRLLEKVDEAFGGEPFLSSLPPDHPKNQARFQAYVGCMKAATGMQNRAIELWFKAHGLDPSQPEQWLQMALVAGGQIGAAAALTGAKNSAQIAQAFQQQSSVQSLSDLLPEGLTKFDLKLAQYMREKAEMYDLKLPDISEIAQPVSKKTH